MFEKKLHYSPKKRKEIVYNLRLKGLKFTEIARILGVSRQRIHQIDKDYRGGDGRSFYKKEIICEICGTKRIIKKDILATYCKNCISWMSHRRARGSTKTIMRQYQKKTACEMCLRPFEERGQYKFKEHNRCVKCQTRINRAKREGDKRLRVYLTAFYKGEPSTMKWPLQSDIPYKY